MVKTSSSAKEHHENNDVAGVAVGKAGGSPTLKVKAKKKTTTTKTKKKKSVESSSTSVVGVRVGEEDGTAPKKKKKKKKAAEGEDGEGEGAPEGKKKVRWTEEPGAGRSGGLLLLRQVGRRKQ